jgi:hypothetical protein
MGGEGRVWVVEQVACLWEVLVEAGGSLLPEEWEQEVRVLRTGLW